MLIYHLALGNKWFKIFGIKSFVSVSTSQRMVACCSHLAYWSTWCISEWVGEWV